ncbi:hypothetical protein [Veillonella montpellierensis]|uniref:hypothetical protein n=1 Tax=Veillonella montpellierensis TaxID=187328 RepID=UPI0023F98DFA|nr:hypothetical protein [Veillonella montpellierensis]
MEATKITTTMGKAIWDAYSMNAWSDIGAYYYWEEELHCWRGFCTTDESIYDALFKKEKNCIDWLVGNIKLDDLKEDRNGIHYEREGKKDNHEYYC